MSAPKDPRNHCFIQKGKEPLTERIQFRGTELMRQKIDALAELHNTDPSEVLRIIVMQYQHKSEHFEEVD